MKTLGFLHNITEIAQKIGRGCMFTWDSLNDTACNPTRKVFSGYPQFQN